MGYVRHSSFVTLLQERAVSQPNRIIFTFLGDGETESNHLTYHQLDQQARAIAFTLQQKKAQGERALLLYQPGLEFVTAFLGCLYAGVIATPAYPPRANRSYTRLSAIIKDAGAQFALTTTALKEKIEQKLTKYSAISCISTDNISHSIANGWQRPHNLNADSTAFLQYTSGSTGTPKGVIVSHGNLIHNSQLIRNFFQNTETSIGASWLPPYHDMGLIGGILQPIYSQISTIMLPPVTFLQRPIRWLKAISKYKVTTTGGPNFAYEMCVNSISEKQKKHLDLSSWKLAFSGAEPVRAETIAKFSQYFADCGFQPEAFYPCYGMAETTLIVSGASTKDYPTVKTISANALQQNRIIFNPEDKKDIQTVVSSGKVAPELDSMIVNPDTLMSCPDDTVGEIWVKGDSVAQGYWLKDELTKNTFFAHTKDGKNTGFLRTGDLGFIHHGELFVTGRLKDLIIIRGRNHYPQDIEETVGNCHEAINSESGAAFAIDKDEDEKLVVIFEVKRTFLQKINQDQDLEAEIFNSIRQVIAQHHELQVYSVVLIRTGSIPKTSSGKIARYACRQEFLAGNLSTVAQWSVDNKKSQSDFDKNYENITFNSSINTNNKAVINIQKWLQENIANRLHLKAQQIDIEQPFANYGLDSVQAIQLTADLEDLLNCKLSPTLAYDYPDIKSLAFYLGSQKKLNEIEVENDFNLDSNTEKIAIVAMACRFPGANNCDEYWQLLSEGSQSINKPYRRTNLENLGGYIKDYDKFDPQFFGISTREAISIDPQQRILLEVTYEALENANLSGEKLSGSATGVFVGISSQDYAQLQMKNGWEVNVYSGTGNSSAIASNRISYNFNLTGPSLSVDTACSSSLVAVHLAVNSLKSGECDCAIVGGVNLILASELTETFQKAGMMAEDGRCKTFSEDADGYGRGEGCGVVILKPLSKAIAEGDEIWGVIHGSAINQDGRSNGLTAPSGKAQQKVVQSAWKNASITPDKINYIEAHGTGTPLGDPIEVNSLGALLPTLDNNPAHSSSSGKNNPSICWLGSAKTNIGHLEAAAGIAGLIKTLLMLRHETIPPIVNFTQLNPYINLDNSRLQIATEKVSWQKSSQPRFAGVSSFGFGGTNAHVIVGDMVDSSVRNLEEKHEVSLGEKTPIHERPYHLLTLSATNEKALGDLVTRYQDYLQTKDDDQITNICYTTNQGRSHFNHRLALVVKNKKQLQEKLTSLVIDNYQNHNIINNQIAFLFTGQGSQYQNMGYELYQTSPIFKNTIDHCEQILNQYLKTPLTQVILNPQDKDLINQTAYTQPAIFVMEYALAQLWLSWGIKPSIMMGHSVGEYVAATLAGVFSLEDALKLIAHRGKLMQQLPLNGGMVCFFTNLDTVNSLIQETALPIDIAAINGNSNIVVSGKKEDLDFLQVVAKKAKVKSRSLKVSHGFHSRLMQPMLTEFTKIANQVTYNLPQVEIVSNVTGVTINEEIATADYWIQHIIKPVKFAQSIEYLRQQDYQVFLEIGAKPTLLGMARMIVENNHLSNNHLWLPSIRKGESDWENLLTSLGILYHQGFKINWHGFNQYYPYLNKVRLPNYPWQHRRYWHGESQGDSVTNIGDWLYQVSWHKDNSLSFVNQEEEETLQGSQLMKDFSSASHHGEEKIGHSVTQIKSNSQHLSIDSQIKDYQPSSYLIFVDEEKVATRLFSQLTLEGNQVYLVYQGKKYQQKKNIYYINPQDKQDYEKLLNSVSNKVEKIIYGWGINQDSNEVKLDDFVSHNYLHCLPVIYLIQNLVNHHYSLKLWLVTKNSQRITNHEIINPSMGGLWGLGKVISLENSEYWGGMIDIDTTVNFSSEVLTSVVNNNETMTAVRNNSFYYARLEKKDNDSQASDTIKVDSQSSYLITGGLGALGLETADYLIKQGAKNLILVSRSQPKEDVEKKITSWQNQGINLVVRQGDVTQEESLGKIVAEIKNSFPPLKGVIHTAGVLDDAILATVSPEKLTKVMNPKIVGVNHLHNLTLDCHLDFFILFSSVASMLGSIGQGNYAIANSYLDSFSAYRQSLGLPALSINWGTFDVGMATSTQKTLTAIGIETIPASVGISLLGKLNQQDNFSVGVINVNWNRIVNQFPQLSQSSYLQNIVVSSSNSKATKENENNSDLFNRLQTVTEIEKENLLIDYLRSAIALILHLDKEKINPEDSLIDLGMDSLMVMEAINHLKTDLQLMLYPREIYERPKINALANYLAQEFTTSHGNKIPSPINTMATSPLTLAEEEEDKPTFNPTNHQPIVFILSSPRSGSTLLRVMLAGHPNLISPPELHLLPFATMQERQAELESSHLGEGLIRTLMDLKQISAQESETLINQWVEENLTIAQVYEILQNLSKGKILVDKSPTYSNNINTLYNGENIFSQAKYIHLVRHPYSVIESFARMRMDKLLAINETNPYQIAETIWYKSNYNVFKFANILDENKVLPIFYENLVTHPEQEMQKICNFLGINFTKSLLNPYEGERMTQGLHQQSLSVGDPNFNTRKKIDPNLANHWQKINLPILLNPITVKLAQSFNYDLPQELAVIETKEAIIKIRELNLCVCSWGDPSNPLLVLVHGILDQGMAWEKVAQTFAQQGYYVIAPDMRGHGKSDHNSLGCAYNLLDFVADLDCLINYFSPDKKITLVGHSFGSMVTGIYSSMRSEKVEATWFVEPILPTENKGDKDIENITSQLNYLLSVPSLPVFDSVKTVAQRLEITAPNIDKTFALKLAERMTKPVNGGVTFTYSPLLATRVGVGFNSIPRNQYLQLLSRISIPITIVYGKDSSFNRPEDLTAQQSAMAQAEIVSIDGGHNLHLENPLILAQVLIR